MRTDLWGLCGGLVGVVLAPLVFLAGLLRRRRVFHPDGLCYRARVTPCPGDPRLHRVAARLGGFALVRLSGALWAGPGEQKDALGAALRLRSDREVTAVPGPGDQDLLTATFDSFLRLGAAVKATDAHDFLDNDYFAVAPFEIDGLGRGKLRLVGSRGGSPAAGGSRDERLRRAAAAGQAGFRLEARARGEQRWLALADVTLEAPVTLADAALRFSPFRDGRGLSPRGFQHGLRHAAYFASQAARRLRGG